MAKKKKQNTSLIIITAAAALLAAAAVIFLIWTVSSDDGGEEGEPEITTTRSDFTPTSELLSEAQQAAYDLLNENYKIYNYLTKGMDVKEEPYGNEPEDGLYTCVNDELKTYDDFCEYIKSVYTEETAAKLISDPFGKGAVYGEEEDGGLGLSADFAPSAEERLSWENVQYVCTPSSDTECLVEVNLKDRDGNDVKETVNMIKEADGWRLDEMIG